jgi:threonine aldolase
LPGGHVRPSGSAKIAAEENDLSLADIARLTDAFYIGGTKNGALIGEALVIGRGSLQQEFRFHIKQKGAMLAKGRLLGVQFLELFRNDLYFDLARHANAMAALLRDGIARLGYGFLTHSPSNQIFPILPNRMIDRLAEHFEFHIWSKAGEETSAIRLVTSWATREDAVAAFLAEFAAAHG